MADCRPFQDWSLMELIAPSDLLVSSYNHVILGAQHQPSILPSFQEPP